MCAFDSSSAEKAEKLSEPCWHYNKAADCCDLHSPAKACPACPRHRTGEKAPPWGIPPRLIINPLAYELAMARPDWNDPDACYEAMRVTGIKPSAIGFYWQDAVREAKKRLAHKDAVAFFDANGDDGA